MIKSADRGTWRRAARWVVFVPAMAALAGCATTAPQSAFPASGVEVQILAINDFHGNLEPPRIAVQAPSTSGEPVYVPAGGVAYLAGAAKVLRAGRPFSMTVSAGDMIGASPLVSALYLDEPTIEVMEEVGVDYNAVGNHEFDKGAAELLRMQRGGCDKHTTRQPCGLEPFDGADFRFLAANVVTEDGATLFPGTAIKDFGPVQVGIIGMTLKETASVVTPSGVTGLTFADEADTANAAIPALKAAGADAIVVLIHQGARTSGGFNDKSCPELSGDVLPIIARLDPAVDLVVSGHTHAAYVCELPRAGAAPLLLTSAGRYGTLITDIRLGFGKDGRLSAKRADNRIVQGEAFATGGKQTNIVPEFQSFPADPATQALVARYLAAAAPAAARKVGKLSGPATKQENAHGESLAALLVADAQLAAARRYGAQIAFINSGGVRAPIEPQADGTVSFGQIFAAQPFGNNLVVKTLSGARLKALLEQQFASGSNSADRPNLLLPSNGFSFDYDQRRAPDDRVLNARLNGRPLDPAAEYRVAVNNFLASGGDNFTVLSEGAAVDAGPDLDALEAWLAAGAVLPSPGRIRNLNHAVPH